MFPYWSLFAVWAVGAVQFARRQDRPHSNILYAAAAAATALMIGLRSEVGGDWGAYLGIYEVIYWQPLVTALTLSDPAYAFLNWLSARADWGIWLPNTVCAAVFMAGVGKLAARQPNPWLAILVAVPYLVIVVAMGYTRQAAAIGVVCYALADARPDRLFRSTALVVVAALFHKTAILVLPILLIPVLRRNLLYAILGGLAFLLLAYLVLAGSSDRLVASYAQSTYESQGAAVRIAMNVLPALLLLLFRRRMDLPPFLRSYWIANAVLALASVPALLSLSASVGVDRLSLFLIPLQMVVYSRLPYALSTDRAAQPVVFLGVIAYSFAVQYVWLNFAVNADSWLPYATLLGGGVV